MGDEEKWSADVERVSAAYRVLLGLPYGSRERLELEFVLAALRAIISERTGVPAEDVQNYHEWLARRDAEIDAA